MVTAPDSNFGAEPASIRAAVCHLRGKRILLVDDYPLNQEVALALLNKVGVETVVATDGNHALKILQRETFDAVLMDCQMPVMDGYEATRRIRRIERLKNLPVIALTAHAMPGDREKCLDAGMVDHIAKPVQEAKLYLTLVHWICRSGQAEQSSVEEQTGLKPQHGPEADDWRSQLSGVDVDAGMSIVMDQEELYLRMLRIFLDTHADFERRFQAAMDQGSSEAAQRMAHNLKSGAGTIGAKTVQIAANALEESFKRAESASQIESKRAYLTGELQPVLAGLWRLFDFVGEQSR